MIPRPRRLLAIGAAEWRERAVQAVLAATPLRARPTAAIWPFAVPEDPDAVAHPFDPRRCPVTGRLRRSHWRLAGVDPKPLWALHTLRHLVGAPPDDVAEALADWVRRNPAGEGPAWEDSLTVATRAACLVWLSARLGADQGPLLGQHRAWLRRFPSTGTSVGNHAVAEAAALHLLGHRDGRLEALLDRLVLPDGGPAEASVRYLALVVEWGLCAHTLHPLRDLAPLRRGAAFLSALCPDPPGMGDDDDSCVFLDAAPYVASVAGAAAVAAGLAPPLLWTPDRRAALLGLADPGRRAAVADHHFPDAGLTLLHGAGETRIAFDHGVLGLPPLRSHGHADALAVWLSVGNRPLLGSLGTSTYRGRMRALQRGAFGHSTVRQGGREPLAQDGPFGWRGDLVVNDVVVGRGNAAASLGPLRRAVLRTPDGFQIHDTCGAPCEIAFWLADGASSPAPGIVEASGRRVELRGPLPWTVEHHVGAAAQGWGHNRDATRLVARVPAGHHRTDIRPA